MKRIIPLLSVLLLAPGILPAEEKTAEAPAIVKLKSDYAAARIAAIGALNKIYAPQVELGSRRQ